MSNQNLQSNESNKSNQAIEEYKEKINKILSELNDPNLFSSLESKIKSEMTSEDLTDKKLNVFLSLLGKKLSQLKDKSNGIKIIKSIANSLKEIDSYLSKILTIIQTTIINEDRDFHMVIAQTFGDIVIISKSITMEKNKVYEILQGFCFYNIRLDIKKEYVK